VFSISSSVRPRLRKSLAAASIASLAAVGLSLGAGTGSASAAGFTTAACQGSAIIGGGASFPAVAHSSAYILFGWPDRCGDNAPSVTYRSSGSGCGQQLMGRHNGSCATSSPYSGYDSSRQKNDTAPYNNSRWYEERFGQSDDPLTTSNITDINAGSDSSGDEGKILQIPNAFGAVAVIVHTPEGCTIFKQPGSTDLMATSGAGAFTTAQQAQISNFGSSNGDIARLQITRAQLVGIFNRAAGFRTWGDIVPWINDGNGTASQAADTRCSSWPIIRIKRADDSGTTYAFKDLLNTLDGSTGWKSTYGSGNQKWPAADALVSWDYDGDGVTSTTATVNGATTASTSVTVADATGIVSGLTVTGTGISTSPRPTVTAVSGNTLTLSAAQTLADGASLSFADKVTNCAQQGTAGTDYGATRTSFANDSATGIGCTEDQIPTLQTSDAASPSGGGNLVEKVYNTNGSIGYASLADARAKKTQAFERQPVAVSSLTGNDYMYWTKLQTKKSGGATFADPSIGTGYQTAGPRGANCSQAVVTGLGTSAPLYDLDKTTTAVTAVDSSDTGYPDCTLSFGLVFQDYYSPYALNIAAAADPAAAKLAEQKKARTVVDYFNSILNEGQGYLQGYDYAPLPSSIKAKAQTVLNTVTFDGYADTVAPVAPSLSGAPSGSTTLKSAAITVTPAEQGGTVEYKVDNGSWTTLVDTSSFVVSGLALGSHTVQVRQTDAASNVGAVATATWTVAAVSVPSLSGAPVDGTSSTSASITVSKDAGTTLQCSVDGAAYSTCTSPITLTGLSAGLHSVAVKAVDSEGNESGAAAASWSITKSNAPALSGAPDGSTTLKTATITVTPAGQGGTVEYKVDNGSWTTLAGSSISLTGLSLGSHTVQARQTANDTVSDVSSVSWTVAAVTAPSISGAPEGSTRSTSATITVSKDTGTTLKCSVDGAAYSTCTSPITLTGLSAGLHSVAVKAVDAAGSESGAAVASWTVTKTPAPTVTPSWTGSNVVVGNGFVTAAGEAGATLTCSIDGVAYTSCTALKGVNTLALGNHTIAFKATDGSGSVSDATSLSFSVVPNNVITVGTISALTSTKKTISVPVTVIPGKGSLSVIATATVNGVADTQIGSLVVSRSAKGPYTAKVNPNSAGLAAIKKVAKTGGLVVTLTIGFTPTGGVQATQTKTVTLK